MFMQVYLFNSNEKLVMFNITPDFWFERAEDKF